MTEQLDKTDLMILRTLQENAKLTRELIHGLSVYRHADIIRRDARSIREELPGEVRQVTEAVEIRSSLKWFFSGRAKRERTVLAAGGLAQFFRSSLYICICPHCLQMLQTHHKV